MLYNFKLIITKICNTRLTTSSRCFERLISTGEFRVPAVNPEDAESKCINFQGTWPSEDRANFLQHMTIIENFLSEDDENKLLNELEPYLKRMRYEFDHWDDAIHGFRETERKHWYPENKQIIQRVLTRAFSDKTLPYVHVLDLAEDGVIKPHVDSTRFCGSTIAGLSLLSDCVMKLVKTKETKEEATKTSKDEYRSKPKVDLENTFMADILLKRRSLYIMSHTARYNFTHEILGKTSSFFKEQKIDKTRRISIICRNEPFQK